MSGNIRPHSRASAPASAACRACVEDLALGPFAYGDRSGNAAAVG